MGAEAGYYTSSLVLSLQVGELRFSPFRALGLRRSGQWEPSDGRLSRRNLWEPGVLTTRTAPLAGFRRQRVDLGDTFGRFEGGADGNSDRLHSGFHDAGTGAECGNSVRGEHQECLLFALHRN